MFTIRVIRSVGAPLSRSYNRGVVPNPAPIREVMVSQSRNLARNTALEDWAVRNIDLNSKNILILTNNLSVSPTNETVLDIKATLLDPDVMEKAGQFEELVISSLPPTLPLASIPDLERGRALLEPGAVGHTVRLELGQGVAAKEVIVALNSIANAFLKDQGIKRLGLVRPDDDWFQGLEIVRTDLEGIMTMASRQMEKRKKKEMRTSKGPMKGMGSGLKDSFGH